MSIGDGPSFDPAKYTPEMTLSQIRELRQHLNDDLMPEATSREASFILRFLSYLDALATRFEQSVDAPLDLLAFVVRNLLEFSALLPVVFESENTKALFMNEAFRIDLLDLQARLDATFTELGKEPSGGGVVTEEELDWLPRSTTRLAGRRTAFDSWLHKFCSKLMHPTAIMIMAGEALSDPDKRITLCFSGLQYLGKSYNFLSETLFLHDQSSSPEVSS
jgi:hypothetical protein